MDKNNFSFGMELELGDVDRTVDIPANLGSWEGTKENGIYQGSECDVVNSIIPWRGICTDPLGIDCPVGGEINVQPTTTIAGQFSQVKSIYKLFDNVSVSHMSHYHIHVHIPGLKDNLELLKRFTKYCISEQEALVQSVYLQNVNAIPDSILKDSKKYLWSDGGRFLRIRFDEIDEAKTIEAMYELFNRLTYYVYNGTIKYSNSKRAAVNLSNLVKNETVEFRCFRPTLDDYELVSQLILVEKFCEEALKEDPISVLRIISKGNYRFAELKYDHINQLGWEKTKQPKSRGDDVKYSLVQFKAPIVASKTCNEFRRVRRLIFDGNRNEY